MLITTASVAMATDRGCDPEQRALPEGFMKPSRLFRHLTTASN